MRSQQGGLCDFHMIQTHHTCIILTDSAPGWCFLPGEFEAFHQYGEEGPRSEACRGHRAARSHRCCMLTDSLTDPHLPCTAAKGCTQVVGGGVGGRMVQTRTDGQGPKSRRSCCSAEHLCQKSTPPWGSPVFVFVFFGGVSSSPKRRGGERRRSSHGANRVLQQEEQQL